MNSTEQLLHIIHDGGVIIYPTDTIRGVGCDATNESAVDKVFALKDRPKEKSVIVLMSSYEMLAEYGVELSDTQKEFLESAVKPTTLIVSGVVWLAPSVYHEDGTLGVRIVAPYDHNPAAQRCYWFVKDVDKPLVSTSANRSGEQSPKNFADIDSTLLQGADGYLDPAVADAAGEASQIVRIDTDGKVTILRP